MSKKQSFLLNRYHIFRKALLLLLINTIALCPVVVLADTVTIPLKNNTGLDSSRYSIYMSLLI